MAGKTLGTFYINDIKEEIMIKTRKYTWYYSIIVTVLLLLTVAAEAMNANQIDKRIAEMLELSKNAALFRASSEQWVNNTHKTLYKLTGKIGVAEMIKIGAPVYHHIWSFTEHGETRIFPELVAGELAKVTEYGGAKLDFYDKSDRRAKKMLIKAASYLPTKIVQRIPTLEALKVTGRGRISQYTDKTVIKTTDVRISLHELGHALEYSDKHLFLMKKDFYENRTQGKELLKLNCGIYFFFYRPDERYRTGFVNRYMGKENGAEVFSCGVEYVFYNRCDIWRKDPEATKFILGSLIFYGSEHFERIINEEDNTARYFLWSVN